MNRDTSGEYASARQPAQTYAKGDRVRVKATGRRGTVRYAAHGPRGYFITVSLDGEGRRTQQFLAANLAKIETLL